LEEAAGGMRPFLNFVLIEEENAWWHSKIEGKYLI
jgi:hypothetical protein